MVLSLLLISILILLLIGSSHIAESERINRFIEHQAEWPSADDEYLEQMVKRALRAADMRPERGNARSTGGGVQSRIDPFAPLSEFTHDVEAIRR